MSVNTISTAYMLFQFDVELFCLSLRVSCGQIYSPGHWWLGIEAIPNLSYKQACTCSSDSNLRWTWFMPSFPMPTIIYKTRNVHGSSKERENKRLLNMCYWSYVFINCNSLKCHMYATVMFIIILKCKKKSVKSEVINNYHSYVYILVYNGHQRLHM